MAAEVAYMHASKVAKASGALRYLNRVGSSKVARLADSAPREVVDDIFSCALKKQTGELGHSTNKYTFYNLQDKEQQEMMHA